MYFLCTTTTTTTTVLFCRFIINHSWRWWWASVSYRAFGLVLFLPAGHKCAYMRFTYVYVYIYRALHIWIIIQNQSTMYVYFIERWIMWATLPSLCMHDDEYRLHQSTIPVIHAWIFQVVFVPLHRNDHIHTYRYHSCYLDPIETLSAWKARHQPTTVYHGGN